MIHQPTAISGESTSCWIPTCTSLDAPATWATPGEELGRALLTLMLKTWADPETGPVLLALLQTAAHEESTRKKLRGFVEGTGLVASQMMGLAMMRYV